MTENDFAYIVSHDLRAHLRHINAFAGLLREELGTALTADTTSYLNQITESARIMGLQLDGLRELAQLDRASVTQEAINMGDFVTQAREALAQQTQGRSIEWEVAQDFPPVTGDPDMVRKVWMHLLSNALKFSGPQARPRIQIGWERAAPGGAVTFFVRDNGVGFEPRHRDQLFQVFRRLHGASEFPGIGMGLALVHKLIQRMGGQVQIEAQPGAGCRAGFSLPQA